MTTLAYDGTLRHRAVPLGDTIEFHKNFASSLIRVRVGHRRGGGRGVGPALAGRSTAVVATRERGRAGRAQLSTPPQLEPDRAGSRCHCSPVPLLACPLGLLPTWMSRVRFPSRAPRFPSALAALERGHASHGRACER